MNYLIGALAGIGIMCQIFLWVHTSEINSLQNQAIEKGYAEIRVINGERKFQWK